MLKPLVVGQFIPFCLRQLDMARAMATIMLLLLVPASGLRSVEEQGVGVGQAEHLDHDEKSSTTKHCQGDDEAPESEKTGCNRNKDCQHCGRGWECYHRSENIMSMNAGSPGFKAAFCTKIF